MPRFSNVKTILLAVLIVIGLVAETRRVAAAETQVLTVAGGCFWCVEANFEKVRGVGDVVSG